jgi:hypothetical protein
VQIEKKQSPGPLPSSTATGCATKVAREYAAIFPTRLALARWTRGGAAPHIQASAHAIPSRAAWYDRSQQQFQAWLEAGGFHQSELDNVGSAIDDCLAPK